VHSHRLFFCIVNDQVLGSDERTADRAAGQNLDTERLKDSPDLARDVVTAVEPCSQSSRGFGWRIHCGVEVTESSTNNQHSLSPVRRTFLENQQDVT
jgi:hypothetical protein